MNRILLALFRAREKAKKVHEKRSTLYTKGKRVEAEKLEVIELKLNQKACLNARLRKKAKILPARFLENAQEWDLKLALEAQNLGWSLWQLEVQIPISGIEKWDRALKKSVMKDGTSLFLYSFSAVEGLGADPAIVEDFWRGVWYWVCSPKTDMTQLIVPKILKFPRWTRLCE